MQSKSKSAVDHWAPLIELLEGRRLLSGSVHTLATAAGDGTYDGESIFDQDLPSDTASNAKITEEGTRESVTVHEGAKTYHEKGSTSVNDSPSSQSVTPQAKHTFLVGIIPQSAGGGVIQIEDGTTMTISGTMTPGKLFYPLSYSFTGTRVKAKAAAVEPVVETAPPQSISVLAKKKTNPLIGIYKGFLTDTDHGLTYKIAVQSALNKKGTPALHAQIGVDGFGEVDLNLVPHAHSTGSFENQLLGSRPTDGILSGHITHTGHLVLNIRAPGLSFTTGNLKRINVAATAALPVSAAGPLGNLFGQNRIESVGDAVGDSLLA